jgi:hypothetical protein
MMKAAMPSTIVTASHLPEPEPTILLSDTPSPLDCVVKTIAHQG